MDIALNQLPIPDWGLECPTCRYPLRGLPAPRCPECGTTFVVADLIRPWTRLRDPRFTGHERPLPDFGLTCPRCHAELAGATQSACPHCGHPFDIEATRPAAGWFVLDREMCGELPIPGVQARLLADGVPHIPVGERTVNEIYGGHSMMIGRLRVPREFFFEVLWLVQHMRAEFAQARATNETQHWFCDTCGEENPGTFEVCWNCEHPHPPDGADSAPNP